MALQSGSQKPHSPLSGTRAPLRVGIILAEHFTLSAFAVFIDHLRLAADELASFYERARYAPATDSLPEEALASARRSLCLLAGVASA